MMRWSIVSGILFVVVLNSCSEEPGKKIARSYTVEIKAMQFQPNEITVKKGDTVVFINKDIVIHDVTEEKDRRWASDSLSTNESYRLIAGETSNYYCTIHPVMKGRVVVE